MSELDSHLVEQLREAVQKQIDWIERRRRMRPLFDTMRDSNRELQTLTAVDLVVKRVLQMRDSVAAMEETNARQDTSAREAERRREQVLGASRRRTAALRALLEILN